MQESPTIQLQQAHLGYKRPAGALSILKNVSFDLFAGDLVGLVGANGTGKSTLLKSISGLLPVLGGDIMISGKPISSYELNELARKIAIVLTERTGGFNLNTWDAVAAGQMPYTDSFHRLTDAHKAVIEKAMAACGISAQRHKPLHELSDGLFQKTMIAKALAQQTNNILLDEPSAFLDYASRHELFLLLKELCLTERKCVLVSSHDLDLLLKYCAKILVVSGQGIELINASEALNNTTFRAIGGGFL